MANDSTQKASFNWLMKMAWRDSRRSRSRLFLFTTSIVLGVAALVAISGFGDNLRRDINNQAKELLGADLVLYTNRVVPDSVQQFLDSLGGVQSRENAFSSMVSFPKSGGTRPVQVRAMEGGFPFYGQFETVPEAAGMEFMNGRKALVDQTLMFQFNAKVGDSIKVGESYFEIAGKLLRVPGENSVFGAIYAPVYIPMAYLDETKLVQKGSRVTFKRYYQFAEEKDVDGMVEGLETRMRDMRLRANTVAERKRNLGAAFADMTRFLNLVAFIALLLGCLGVASAVSIYIREKIPSVAILRCLGASGRQTYWIYLIQIIGMGVVGSLVGAIIGSLVQQIVPWVLGEFIPIQTSMQLSASAILKGIGVGITIAVLFALLPLLSIRRISPLFALRASFEKGMSRFDLSRLAVVGLITLFVLAFAFWQTERLLEASMFTLAVAVGFLALAGVAQGLTWLVRRFFPKQLGYIWRQSLANLYRPQNQTLVLMTSIGLGTALIATLFYVQGTLVQEIELTDQGDRPNMVIFDIKPDEVAQVQELCNEFAFETDQDVPIVNMRLASLKGVSRRELLRDTTNTIRTGSINREYRVTFRDSLIETEELIEGSWRSRVENPGDSIFISLEEGFGKNSLGLEIGDEIVFDVSGVRMATYVGSFRKVDFAQVRTNFLVVFPEGVLENAPQFRVLVTRTTSNEKSAAFQRELAQAHPNVTVIDLALVLRTVEDVLEKVSFVVRFMGFFSIATGLIVLIGSVINSKYQRIRESVLLRTLGASRRQILLINALEYFFLGFLASLTGVLLSMVASWALMTYSFELEFNPAWGQTFVVLVAITILTVVIGLLNIRGILNNPPLEVLRKET